MRETTWLVVLNSDGLRGICGQEDNWDQRVFFFLHEICDQLIVFVNGEVLQSLKTVCDVTFNSKFAYNSPKFSFVCVNNVLENKDLFRTQIQNCGFGEIESEQLAIVNYSHDTRFVILKKQKKIWKRKTIFTNYAENLRILGKMILKNTKIHIHRKFVSFVTKSEDLWKKARKAYWRTPKRQVPGQTLHALTEKMKARLEADFRSIYLKVTNSLPNLCVDFDRNETTKIKIEFWETWKKLSSEFREKFDEMNLTFAQEEEAMERITSHKNAVELEIMTKSNWFDYERFFDRIMQWKKELVGPVRILNIRKLNLDQMANTIQKLFIEQNALLIRHIRLQNENKKPCFYYLNIRQKVQKNSKKKRRKRSKTAEKVSKKSQQYFFEERRTLEELMQGRVLGQSQEDDIFIMKEVAILMDWKKVLGKMEQSTQNSMASSDLNIFSVVWMRRLFLQEFAQIKQQIDSELSEFGLSLSLLGVEMLADAFAVIAFRRLERLFLNLNYSDFFAELKARPRESVREQIECGLIKCLFEYQDRHQPEIKKLIEGHFEENMHLRLIGKIDSTVFRSNSFDEIIQYLLDPFFFFTKEQMKRSQIFYGKIHEAYSKALKQFNDEINSIFRDMKDLLAGVNLQQEHSRVGQVLFKVFCENQPIIKIFGEVVIKLFRQTSQDEDSVSDLVKLFEKTVFTQFSRFKAQRHFYFSEKFQGLFLEIQKLCTRLKGCTARCSFCTRKCEHSGLEPHVHNCSFYGHYFQFFSGRKLLFFGKEVPFIVPCDLVKLSSTFDMKPFKLSWREINDLRNHPQIWDLSAPDKNRQLSEFLSSTLSSFEGEFNRMIGLGQSLFRWNIGEHIRILNLIKQTDCVANLMLFIDNSADFDKFGQVKAAIRSTLERAFDWPDLTKYYVSIGELCKAGSLSCKTEVKLEKVLQTLENIKKSKKSAKFDKFLTGSRALINEKKSIYDLNYIVFISDGGSEATVKKQLEKFQSNIGQIKHVKIIWIDTK